MEDDGNMVMRDVQEDPQGRHTLYTTYRNKRRVRCHSEGRIRVTVWRDRKPLRREMRENTQDGTPGSWFKITFHYVKNRARFFVQGASTASALKDVSYKICDEENEKVAIFVNPSTVPYSVLNKLEPKEMEQLKLTLNKRYNVSQQALDLQNLRFDPDLVGHDIDIILNRRNCMAATLQIIEKDFPELLSLNLSSNKLYHLDGLSDIIQMAPTVKILNLCKNELKSAWELSKMKGLDLEELWLQGNPLCGTFPDHSTYISAIRECFPKLLRLDGKELPPPIIIDIDTPYAVKPCKENYNGSEMLKNLILQFLQQYYMIYDSGDRHGLLSAYHHRACFSLTIPFNPEDPAPSSLREYFKDSRNMKKLKDPYLRVQLLKHTKRDIVRSLCLLPKTQHDFSSFVVDMWLHTDTMLCFSVNGVFKEGISIHVLGSSDKYINELVKSLSQARTQQRSCPRDQIAPIAALRIPDTLAPSEHLSPQHEFPVRLCLQTPVLFIVNDELFVRDTSLKKTLSTFSISVPTPSASSMPMLSQEQQQMVQDFSTQSEMNLQWSQKCLQDNDWNYTRAGQVFTKFKAEGKIPEEAFKQIP
ncbi:Nuclear RNA export factor 2 [Camelus dromedarius]|uniref:Nuclear RNA export factor 2 n=1 Tax=Camelus dromedarius TaxID=9838 RepID=A0A5N4C493_CAMDR|nr:Nuclear RNA export factor 2 [Camelus dromedarius]